MDKPGENKIKKIVIADDSGTARMFIRRCLEIAGFDKAEFVEAANGKEALAIIKAAPPDLLITDLNMPVMDGETLLKWVKSSPKLFNLPVLVITSAGCPEKILELNKLGAYSVLGKPVNPAALLTVLGPLIHEKEPYHA